MPSANVRNFHIAVADHLQEELLAAIGRSQGFGVRLIPDRESLSALQWALPGEASVLIAELDWIVATGLAPGEVVARQRTRGVQLAVVLSASRRLWTHPLLARWAFESGAARLLASLSPARVEATVVPASAALMAAAGTEANHVRLHAFLSSSNFVQHSDDALYTMHRRIAEFEKRDRSLDRAADFLRDEVGIGDKSYLGTTYAEVFVGTEAVDALEPWLDGSRADAVALGQLLMASGRLYHVVREQPFQDGNFFYRLSAVGDSLKSLSPNGVTAAMRSDSGVEVRDRTYLARAYSHCFVGTEAAAWMRERYRLTIGEAVTLGQCLLELGLIRHCLNEHDFVDRNLFYVFNDAPQVAPQAA